MSIFNRLRFSQLTAIMTIMDNVCSIVFPILGIPSNNTKTPMDIMLVSINRRVIQLPNKSIQMTLYKPVSLQRKIFISCYQALVWFYSQKQIF